MEAIMGANALVSLGLKSAASQLFGCLRQFQMFSMASMIDIPDYPGELKTFFKIMGAFSEQDVLQGPKWFEQYLDLTET